MTAGVITEHRLLQDWLATLKESKTCTDEPRMVRALEAIDENLMGKVTQDVIARAAGMSKSSFTNGGG